MKRHRALLAFSLFALTATPLLATWDDGVAAFRAGRYADAAEVFQSFVDRSPTAPEGHYMLGLSLLQQKRPVEALEPLGQAVTLGKDDLRYRLTLAQALLKASKPGEAFTALEAMDPTLVTAPSRASFNQLMAYAATSSGRDGDAFASVEKALAADEGSKALWLARANLAARLGRAEDEFAAQVTAFDLDPSDAGPAIGAVHTAMDIAEDPKTGDLKHEWYVKAASVADRLAATFPTPKNLRLAGSANMGAKDYERSFGYFEKLLATSGQDPLVHFDLGRCLQALDKDREALDSYEAALARSPETKLAVNIHNRRGMAMRDLEDFTGAATAFRLANDNQAAVEMDAFAQNRREWAEAKADCAQKRSGLEDLLAGSEGLEHTREYKEVKQDLDTILSVCQSYFSEQS